MNWTALLALAALGAELSGADRSLSKVIAAAKEGDTILVEPGLYEGNLVIDKPLTLKGKGRPVIRGEGKGSVVTVLAGPTVIEGFLIEHSGGGLEAEDSGVLLRSSGNRIVDNELRDVLYGIYFFGADHNQVSGNVISGRPWLEQGERGSGIHIWKSSDNTITDNVITGVRDGMYLQNADRSKIERNRVSEVRYGLHYMFSNDNTFEDNVFERNVAGAAIMYSMRISFRRNAFIRNRGFASYGILFQDSDYLRSENNVFADNAVGIFMEALRNSVFEGNLMASNDTAVLLFASAMGNEFTRNNFIGNLSPIRVIGKNTRTRWSRNGTGNYWQEYEGYDLDGDSIGDVPFRIQNLFEHLEGNYPRLRLYFFSPASQALAAAEKTFPIIRGSDEQDPHPLMRPAALALPRHRENAPGGAPAVGIPVAASILAISLTVLVREKRK